jgi:2-octaprenyl-6-methoxyphenol hydroxylase
MVETEICVVGGGLAGHTAALALANAGRSVILIAPAAERPDRRTTALLEGSVRYLEKLAVWQAIAPHAAPVSVQTLIDDTGRLFRAPYTAFHAAEIGLDAFGYNVANDIFVRELSAASSATGKVERIASTLVAAEIGDFGCRLVLQDGSEVEAGLAVAADGRNSTLRRLAGISAREWSYPQSALVLNFTHSQPHHDTCYEFHGPNGPFTIVPLGPDTSSLVWVDSPATIAQYADADLAELQPLLERRMHSVLGKVRVVSDRQIFPLSALVANRLGQAGLVLVGEAGHAIPPIAAQGFNLGIRDIELLEALARSPGPAGLAGVGPVYHRNRVADVNLRAYSVDLFNRSLLSTALPFQFGRGVAMWTLGLVGPLRRAVMREGVAPGGEIGRLREHLVAAKS